MTDIDYAALFGVEEGAEAQEPADPAQPETATEGEEAQEPAAPAGSEDTASGEAQPEQSGAQSAERNAAFAAARRKAEAERDAAIAKAKADAALERDTAIKDVFATMGIKNPYTKQPITTMTEYEAYKARYSEERKSSMLKKLGMSDDEFSDYVNELPEVRAARAEAASARKAQEEAAAAAAKADIEAQVAEIAKLDPNIKTLNDLAKMENYAEFYEKVKRGYTLVDAYESVNRGRRMADVAASAKQAALNAAAGKGHMQQTQARGAGAQEVPESVMREYRIWVPNATDAEIRAHYNKNHKT